MSVNGLSIIIVPPYNRYVSAVLLPCIAGSLVGLVCLLVVFFLGQMLFVVFSYQVHLLFSSKKCIILVVTSGAFMFPVGILCLAGCAGFHGSTSYHMVIQLSYCVDPVCVAMMFFLSIGTLLCFCPVLCRMVVDSIFIV